MEVSFLSETTTRYNAKIQPWTTDLLIADWKSLAEVSIRQYTTPQVLLYAKTIIIASDHAGTKVKNSCKCCRLKWIQTSLIRIFLCFSWMIMTTKQRKMQIKLVWNHFVLKFILTYNTYLNDRVAFQKSLLQLMSGNFFNLGTGTACCQTSLPC